MNVWRINLIPDADDGVNPRQFCLANNVIGFGWPVDTDEASMSWDAYSEAAKAKYPDNSSWKAATKALRDRMEEGDLAGPGVQRALITWLGLPARGGTKDGRKTVRLTS